MRQIACVLLLLLAGCGRNETEQVVVDDLNGVPAYTGDWQPAGGNAGWTRPVYYPSMRMSPPMRVSPTWNSIALVRQRGDDRTLEVDGKVLAAGLLRGGSFTPGGCPATSVRRVTIAGKTYGPFARWSPLCFTPDRAHWYLLATDDKDNKTVIVNGMERQTIDRSIGVIPRDWVRVGNDWVVALHGPDADDPWIDLDGQPVAVPPMWFGPDPKSPGKVTIEPKLGGPQTVIINGRVIGTYTFVLSGSYSGDQNLAAKYGLDAAGRIVFYAVNTAGQLVRVSVKP